MRAAVQEAAVLGHEVSSLAVKDFFNHRWELRLTWTSKGAVTRRRACGGAGLTPPQESNELTPSPDAIVLQQKGD